MVGQDAQLGLGIALPHVHDARLIVAQDRVRQDDGGDKAHHKAQEEDPKLQAPKEREL